MVHQVTTEIHSALPQTKLATAGENAEYIRICFVAAFRRTVDVGAYLIVLGDAFRRRSAAVPSGIGARDQLPDLDELEKRIRSKTLGGMREGEA